MKKKLCTITLVLFSFNLFAADDLITIIDVKPTTFASSFNKLNTHNNVHIKLKNTEGEYTFKLSSNIDLEISTYTDGIEYVSLRCSKPSKTAESCTILMTKIAKSINTKFNQKAFYTAVGRNFSSASSVAYRQNGIEFHVIPDIKNDQLRFEVHPE